MALDQINAVMILCHIRLVAPRTIISSGVVANLSFPKVSCKSLIEKRLGLQEIRVWCHKYSFKLVSLS